jgi:hypothetical protein
MAFDPGLDSAYYEGIKPAVLECGYEPVRLKEIATNDNICDLILSELRSAATGTCREDHALPIFRDEFRGGRIARIRLHFIQMDKFLLSLL